MKKKIFNGLLAVMLGVSFSLMAAPAIASSVTLTINESPSPVFPTSTLIPDQAYVIKDNVNYKLYYADNDFESIRLAQSPDGITWTPYGIVISGEGYHADVHYYSTGFTGADNGTNPSALPMYYRMWYGGLYQHSIDGWRYAESPDGINWYNRMPVTQGAGPLVWGTPHMGVHYGIADAIYTPGASNTGTDWTFRIYANAQWEDAPYSTDELVVMAFSSNGYEWIGYDPTNVGYATPVFTPSLDPGRFDCDHIGWFKVLKNSPTDWEAFYSGGKLTTYQALNGIGYATSTDGINWTRRQTLFTTSDGVAWRSQSVWMPSVVKTGSNYQIWFLGSDNPIDGSDWIQWKLGEANLTVASTIKHCDWVEYGNNPVFGQWLGGDKAYYPKVIYDVNQFSGHGNSAYYKMWFGSSSGIGYATSNDGINWTTGANPVIGLIAGANHPLVKYDPNGFGGGIYYKMWYKNPAVDYSIGALQYAESTDGINWTNDPPLTQDSSAPVITGISTDWNYGSYGPCDLIYNSSGSNSLDDTSLWNNKYVMYYMGTNGDNEFIGLAYSDNGTDWKGYGNAPVLNPCTLANDPNQCWDYLSVGYCSVIKLSGNNWQMWYGGGPNTNRGIGYATSTDGINWTKDPDNPIFHISDNISWRNERTYTPWVLYDAAKFSGHGDAYSYKMWFSGTSTDGKYSIGYAYISPVLADAGPDQTIIPGGSTPIGGTPTASGGMPPYSYSWNPTAGLNDSTLANPTASPTSTTTYTVTVTDNKSCTGSDNMTLFILPPSPISGGGGGLPASFIACPMTLVANMQGTIATVSMTKGGVLCKDCLAKDAANKDTLELDKDTKVMLAGNTVPMLLRFSKASVTPPTPENTEIVGSAYEINAFSSTVATIPSSITISPAAKLLLSYNPDELPKNTSEVFIATYDTEKGWLPLEPVPGEVAEIGKAHGLVNHFTIFAVLAKLAPPEPAKFEVGNLTISLSQAQPNQKVTISINVTNTGGESGDYNLDLKVDGAVRSSKQVIVAAGTNQTVNFTTTGYAAGKHQVEVAGLTGEFDMIKVTQPTHINWLFIGGITAIILLIIVVLIVWMR